MTRTLKVLLLVLLAVGVALPTAYSTFIHSERDVVIGAHDATVQPTFSGYARIDFGTLIPQMRVPAEAPLGLGVDIRLGDSEITNLDQLVARDAAIAAQPQGEIASVRSTVHVDARSTRRCERSVRRCWPCWSRCSRGARSASLVAGRSGPPPATPSAARSWVRAESPSSRSPPWCSSRHLTVREPTTRRGSRSARCSPSCRPTRCSTRSRSPRGRPPAAAGRSSRARWRPIAPRCRSTAGSR